MPASSSPATEPSDTTGTLVDALARTTFTVITQLTRIAAAHELSLTQLRMLGILRDHTPRIVELAQALGVDKSSASGLVDRAEARGLLARRRSSQDRRAFEVHLTPDGHALAETGAAEVRAAFAPLIDRLDAATQQRLGADLLLMLES